MLALVSEFLNQVLFTCNSYIFTKVDRRNNSWRLEHQLMLPSSAWLLTPNCRTQVLKQVHALFCKRSCTNYVIFCMLASHSWSNLGEWCWLASLTLTPSGIQFSWTYIDQWSCSFPYRIWWHRHHVKGYIRQRSWKFELCRTTPRHSVTRRLPGTANYHHYISGSDFSEYNSVPCTSWTSPSKTDGAVVIRIQNPRVQ